MWASPGRSLCPCEISFLMWPLPTLCWVMLWCEGPSAFVLAPVGAWGLWRHGGPLHLHSINGVSVR